MHQMLIILLVGTLRTHTSLFGGGGGGGGGLEA